MTARPFDQFMQLKMCVALALSLAGSEVELFQVLIQLWESQQVLLAHQSLSTLRDNGGIRSEECVTLFGWGGALIRKEQCVKYQRPRTKH